METIERIERNGCTGTILAMDDAEMPDFDGNGHIFLVYRGGWGGVRCELKNIDHCAGSGDDYAKQAQRQADEMQNALVRAVERWGWDFDFIERYFRAFYGGSIDYTHWDRDSYLIGVAPRELRTTGWGNPDGVVNLAPYEAYRDGEVYGYTVETDDGEHLDSCWGYYGDGEMDYIRTLINEAIDDHVAKGHAARVDLFRRLVNNR